MLLLFDEQLLNTQIDISASLSPHSNIIYFNFKNIHSLSRKEMRQDSCYRVITGLLRGKNYCLCTTLN